MRPDWTFEAVQLPLFQDALPVKNLTPGGPKPDGFTAPVNGSVNRDRVKDGEEAPAGTSAALTASGTGTGTSAAFMTDRLALIDYLRSLGLNESQVAFEVQRRGMA